MTTAIFIPPERTHVERITEPRPAAFDEPQRRLRWHVDQLLKGDTFQFAIGAWVVHVLYQVERSQKSSTPYRVRVGTPEQLSLTLEKGKPRGADFANVERVVAHIERLQTMDTAKETRKEGSTGVFNRRIVEIRGVDAKKHDPLRPTGVSGIETLKTTLNPLFAWPQIYPSNESTFKHTCAILGLSSKTPFAGQPSPTALRLNRRHSMSDSTTNRIKKRPLLLDLFCCAGGAAMGYYRAGFEVVGIDIMPQPRYPFLFIQGDAFHPPVNLLAFDAIHASPPCQGYSHITPAATKDNHPRLIPDVRAMLVHTGLPYVIENVGGARHELINPIMLCGAQFGLKVYRHRFFESNRMLTTPYHAPHRDNTPSAGHGMSDKGFISITKHGITGVSFEYRQKAMGIDWMLQYEMGEAVSPELTEWIGRQLLDAPPMPEQLDLFDPFQSSEVAPGIEQLSLFAGGE